MVMEDDAAEIQYRSLRDVAYKGRSKSLLMIKMSTNVSSRGYVLDGRQS